jgi:6-phosphogluconolactonase
MIPATISRRSFLKSFTALAGAGPILASSLMAQAGADKAPLIAYVGTYTSALPIIRPGQVDLPAGNGRGIHLFDVDRVTGASAPRATLGRMPVRWDQRRRRTPLREALRSVAMICLTLT